MIGNPISTAADPHGYIATVMAVRNLFLRQAMTLEKAWAILFQEEHGPDMMPAEAEGPTREALMDFGYTEHFATPVGGGETQVLWLRADWQRETIEEVPLT